MVLYSQGRDTAGNFERSKTPPTTLSAPVAECAGEKSLRNRENGTLSLYINGIEGSDPAGRAKPASSKRPFHERNRGTRNRKLLHLKANMWLKNRS
jgi:hypothetical protein